MQAPVENCIILLGEICQFIKIGFFFSVLTFEISGVTMISEGRGEGQSESFLMRGGSCKGS